MAVNRESDQRTDAASYDTQVATFLDDYGRPRTQQQFERLVRVTKLGCEKLLRSIEIKGVVQGRVKKYESLRAKLAEDDLGKDVEDITPCTQVTEPRGNVREHVKDASQHTKLAEPKDDVGKDVERKELAKSEGSEEVLSVRDWVLRGKDIGSHPDMGDLAGVRIGLFFPDDIVKVAQEIIKCFDMVHCFGTVTGGRTLTYDNKRKIDEHLKGPFHDDSGDDWQQPGYKSWQMVVEWKEARALPIDLEYLQPLQKELPKRLQSRRVEIQVGTVVTQAWAEVQHNIIYKRPADLLATPTMKRMIDATNGLAITTEILLNELQRGLRTAEREAYALAQRPIRGADEFLTWFEYTYTSRMGPEERLRWARPQDKLAAGSLLRVCNQPPPDMQSSTVQPCRACFKALIETRGLLKLGKIKEAHDLDISKLMLQFLGFTNVESTFARCRDSNPKRYNLHHPKMPSWWLGTPHPGLRVDMAIPPEELWFLGRFDARNDFNLLSASIVEALQLMEFMKPIDEGHLIQGLSASPVPVLGQLTATVDIFYDDTDFPYYTPIIHHSQAVWYIIDDKYATGGEFDALIGLPIIKEWEKISSIIFANRALEEASSESPGIDGVDGCQIELDNDLRNHNDATVLNSQSCAVEEP